MMQELTSPVEVLWTARYDYQPHWKLARHRHEYFQMIYFICGSGSLSLEDLRYPVKAGSLLLVKPRRFHALNPTSLVKTLDIKFAVKDRRLHHRLLSASDLLADAQPALADLFERIRHEGERKANLYRELCNISLAELLLRYLRSDAAQEDVAGTNPVSRDLSGDWVVQQAARFMQEHHAEDCNLLQLAQVVGRSDRDVRQHFKDALGVSPHLYLLQYRIRKAQEMIEYSDYPFKEIADKAGFKTVQHFTRVFHEFCGETPGAWRKKYQAGICKDVYLDPGFVNTNRTVQAESADSLRATQGIYPLSGATRNAANS